MLAPSLVVVADDLTGALDTTAPFALRGMRVRVALDASGIDEALAHRPDVLAVSTGSRGLSEAEAIVAVEQVAGALAAAPPRMIFKKVDTRLQGHPGQESLALARAFGRSRLLGAPAAPDQGRVTAGGSVIGRGVRDPISIAAAFPAATESVSIIGDVRTGDDLANIARGIDWSAGIAVGARGLGEAVAALLAEALQVPPLMDRPAPFIPSERTLIAFGSRDPITAAQVAHVGAVRSDIPILDAPCGSVEPCAMPLPLILQCTGDALLEPARVAARFACATIGFIRSTNPDTVVMGGGDTAAAILSTLGLRSIALRGEVLPGMPHFEARPPGGTPIAFVTKSGGFGAVDALHHVIPVR